MGEEVLENHIKFMRNSSSGKMHHFWIPNKWLFKILHNKRGQEVNESYINPFQPEHFFQFLKISYSSC